MDEGYIHARNFAWIPENKELLSAERLERNLPPSEIWSIPFLEQRHVQSCGEMRNPRLGAWLRRRTRNGTVVRAVSV